MSTYPTTAELAAFRRAIADRYGSVSPFVGPSWTAAWPSERWEGIGWRLSAAPYADTIWPHRALLARQDASALRSRAYARRFPHDFMRRAYLDERQNGCPSPFHPAYDALS